MDLVLEVVLGPDTTQADRFRVGEVPLNASVTLIVRNAPYEISRWYFGPTRVLVKPLTLSELQQEGSAVYGFIIRSFDDYGAYSYYTLGPDGRHKDMVAVFIIRPSPGIGMRPSSVQPIYAFTDEQVVLEAPPHLDNNGNDLTSVSRYLWSRFFMPTKEQADNAFTGLKDYLMTGSWQDIGNRENLLRAIKLLVPHLRDLFETAIDKTRPDIENIVSWDQLTGIAFDENEFNALFLASCTYWGSGIKSPTGPTSFVIRTFSAAKPSIRISGKDPAKGSGRYELRRMVNGKWELAPYWAYRVFVMPHSSVISVTIPEEAVSIPPGKRNNAVAFYPTKKLVEDEAFKDIFRESAPTRQWEERCLTLREPMASDRGIYTSSVLIRPDISTASFEDDLSDLWIHEKLAILVVNNPVVHIEKGATEEFELDAKEYTPELFLPIKYVWEPSNWCMRVSGSKVVCENPGTVTCTVTGKIRNRDKEKFTVTFVLHRTAVCKRCRSAFRIEENIHGACVWHMPSPPGVLPDSVAVCKPTELRPVYFGGFIVDPGQDSKWACCCSDRTEHGCWVGRHSVESTLPDISDVLARQDAPGSVWRFNTWSSQAALDAIDAAKDEKRYRDVLALEFHFNSMRGAIFSLPDELVSSGTVQTAFKMLARKLEIEEKEMHALFIARRMIELGDKMRFWIGGDRDLPVARERASLQSVSQLDTAYSGMPSNTKDALDAMDAILNARDTLIMGGPNAALRAQFQEALIRDPLFLLPEYFSEIMETRRYAAFQAITVTWFALKSNETNIALYDILGFTGKTEREIRDLNLPKEGIFIGNIALLKALQGTDPSAITNTALQDYKEIRNGEWFLHLMDYLERDYKEFMSIQTVSD
jgi:hypothetical protein